MNLNSEIRNREIRKPEIRSEDLERLQGLRLLDDCFMTKCFEDDLECTELLVQIILGRDDITVNRVETQRHIKNLQGRSLTLDIYATDTTGRKLNIEVQREDRDADPKRARYHCSVIDANITEPGDKFQNLAETYVIFITEHDVLEGNQPVYHIERMIQETNTSFGDESHILYVNGEYREETPLGDLMHDFSCTKASDMKYKPLAERVKYFKETEKGVKAMGRVFDDIRNEGVQEGIKKGIKEGVIKASTELARRLMAKGTMTYEEIAELTELTLEEIQELSGKKGA